MTYRVLIVDDQKGVSRLLRSALETIQQGLVVSEAPSGEEAILEASRTRIDLLVADYRLPGINGVELLKKFRVINPLGKVIMISGVVDPRMFRQISEAVPDAFFAKPVPMSDFLAAVENCLGLIPTIIKPLEKLEPVSSEQPIFTSLGDVLIGLRKSLNAQAVLLVDREGQVEAEAGGLQGQVDNSSLIAALMGLLSAADKASSLSGHPAGQLHLFNGDENDSILLPVGASYALYMAGKGLADVRLLAPRLELIFAARQNLLQALASIQSPEAQVNIPEPISANMTRVSEERVEAEPVRAAQKLAIEEPYTRPEDLPGDFLNIFNQLDDKKLDANRFWDDVIEKGTTFSEPDKLTYEQASRLGLTPDSAMDK